MISLKIKRLYVTISNKLVKDIAGIVYKVGGKYVYLTVYIPDVDRQACIRIVKFCRIGKFLTKLEKKMGGKLELVYENFNDKVLERIKAKLEKEGENQGYYKMLKYL